MASFKKPDGSVDYHATSIERPAPTKLNRPSVKKNVIKPGSAQAYLNQQQPEPKR
jgi:hypothetical protein